ncbi:hypothetical protein ACFWIW_10985 [Amycolatopsis sp. NPDC058340]|uniref:hypothetical protein n=1 Tax=Amycolatopsis sp. NPDC058340 TaxID=3346453 RepID=UPI003647CF3D
MSRALEQADLLSALATHLRAYPHLQRVNVGESAAGFELQIMGYRHLGQPDGVEALLAWAKTFERPEITIRWHQQRTLVTTVSITTRLGGHAVEVWDTDDGDLHRWLTGGPHDRTVITLAQLAAYVAAGTVEHANEHAPAVTS